MDVEKLVESLSNMARDTRKNYHLTLGQLIELLEANLECEIDVGGAPTGLFESYRGYYADLAITPGAGQSRITCRKFLEQAKNALDATFEGYKGGDFVMDKDTPLWFARYSECGDAIVGYRIEGGRVTLVLKRIEL